VPRRRPVIRVTIYSRPGCHLCDDMKDLVRKVSQTIPLTLEDIDIYGDDELEARFGLEIPVLFVEGKRVAHARITEEKLRKTLAGWAGKAG
jgi:glutaredoxin